MKKLLIITIVLLTSMAYAEEQQEILTSVPIAEEQRKINIAILDFKPLGVSASEATFITEFFRSGIVASRAFKVIDKANMDRVLAEQGFQQTGCTTQECAVQMGKLLNVQNMITGNFGRLAGMYQITISLVEVETGEITYSDSANCESGRELQSISNDLADRLIADLAGETVPVEEKKIKKKLKRKAEKKAEEKVKKVKKIVKKKEVKPEKPVEAGGDTNKINICVYPGIRFEKAQYLFYGGEVYLNVLEKSYIGLQIQYREFYEANYGVWGISSISVKIRHELFKLNKSITILPYFSAGVYSAYNDILGIDFGLEGKIDLSGKLSLLIGLNFEMFDYYVSSNNKYGYPEYDFALMPYLGLNMGF